MNPNPLHRSRSARAGALTTFLLLPMALPVSAGNIYWKDTANSATTSLWATAGNWSDTSDGLGAAGVPATTDTAVFNSTNTFGDRSVFLNPGPTIGGLVFNNTGTTTIASNVGSNNAPKILTIGSDGITVASTAGNVDLSTSIRSTSVTLGAPQTWTNNSSTSTLTMACGQNQTFNRYNTLALGANTLTVDGVGATTISSRNITGSGATAIIKNGAGVLTFNSAAATFAGDVQINAGTLRVDGSLGDTAVTVAGGATLGGSGTIGTSSVLKTLTVNGTLAPGASPGILTVNDNLDLNGNLSMEVIGTSAGTGYDPIAVNGAVDITGSTLTTSFSSFVPADGNLLFFLVNDGSDPITGSFTGKAQDAIVASFGGFDWKISYNANSAGGTFTNGNDIALMAVPEPVSVILSSWKFSPGASSLNGHLASSDTATGLTVSRLNFHPTFDAVGFVDNEQATLNAFSTHDRWAADSSLGAIRMRRADYTTAPSGRSATFSSTDTSISSAAGTLGAPIWFSVSTDGLTNATIRKNTVANPGASNPTTYYFSKSGNPLGTGVSVSVQETIALAAPITLAASQTVFFSINMDSAAVGTNHNIDQVNLLGATVALPPPPPPIGLVTGTLTVGAPHGTYNRLSVTVDPDLLGPSSDTSDLTGTIDLTVNIDPDTGKTVLLTLSNGRVNGTDMSFSSFGYNIGATGLSAAVNTLTPPGAVNPDTGVFAANQHGFILDQGTFAGTAGGQPFSETLSSTNTFSGLGTGNGSLTLTPAGTSGPYNLFNAVVILPVAINETIEVGAGVNAVITGTGTIKATGQIQMPSSEFNAWMLGQGATSFDPDDDTAGNGAPDGIKWALGLSSLDDNPLPFLLKPHPTIPGTFTISLPPGGTVAPLTVESSTNLLSPWANVPAGQMAPAANPIPEGSTGTINITPTAANRIFLRTRANP